MNLNAEFDEVFKLLGIAAAAKSVEEAKTFATEAGIKLRDRMAALSASVAGEATKRLCSCKANERDGQHMMWCASLSEAAPSPALDPGTVGKGLSDWLWEKDGPAIGNMTPIEAAKAAFHAGARFARALASPAPGNADHEALHDRVCK